MEAAFKIVFALAILVFCLVVIGIFLLLIKISFLAADEIRIMGIIMTPAP